MAAASDYQLSTHVLDTTTGKPGAGVAVTLEKKGANGQWELLKGAVTNKDGRISDFLEKAENKSHLGTYRFSFALREYFKKQGHDTVLPAAVVVFEIQDNTHYHIPVVVTPYAISTYRGS